MRRSNLLLAILVAGFVPAGDVPVAPASPVCTAEFVDAIGTSTEYYRIDLVSTGRIPGTRTLKGYADVAFAASPFTVSMAGTGHYRYDILIVADGLPPQPGREYVAWVTSPDLQHVERVGALVDGRVATTITLNKYLVVVTLEGVGADAATWEGPIVTRGMSKSGFMHTMAGHGPFDAEPCAKYGY